MTQSNGEFSKTDVADITKNAPLRVLLADDDAGFLKTARQCLEMQGAFQVDTALSVEEAAEKMKKEKYDVVVSDFLMRGKDGLQFLKELRQKGNEIPFIIFTGRGREEVAIKALNLGADGYFNKAGNPETVYCELAHGMRLIVERNRAQEMLEQRNHSLATLNAMSVELASLPPGVIVEEFLVKRLREITGAAAVSFADYETSDQILVGKFLEVEPGMQEKFTGLLGKSLGDIRCPVSEEAYREICSSVVGKRQTLTEATYGGIPPSIGVEVQKLLRVDRFIGVAYIIEGELYGTSLLAIKAGSPDPPREMLESFGHMAAVSLRRRRAEEALRDSEEKFESIFESAGDGLIYLDASGRILDANRKAVEIFGGSKEEVLGENFTKIGIFSLKDMPTLMRNFAGILRGEKAALDITIKNKTGQLIPLECSASLLKINGKSTITVVVRDVSERNKTLDKLSVLNQKLHVVGGLTRHDARNKIATVMNNAYLARITLPKDHKALAYLEGIEFACEQAKRIFDFATLYEKLGAEKLVLMDVGESLEEAISLFSDLKGVKVVNECQGLKVVADSLLNQVFYNLVDNSLKHGKKVSQIRIHSEEGKKGVKLFYEDDGVGIPKAIKPTLFDEAFTTGNGLGYGLPLIKKMMEVYGWSIEEAGTLGEGARFVIRIPEKNALGKENYKIT